MEIIKPGRQFDFMGVKRVALTLSALLMLGAMFAFFVYPKPRLGTDFKGGTEVELVFAKQIDGGAIRSAVEQAGFGSPDVVTVTDSSFENHFLIRVQEVSTISDAEQSALRDALCIPPDDVPIDEAQCPENLRPTEIKFSPGGDKIALRYETDPDLAVVRTRFEGAAGSLELREGENSVTLASKRVELHLKSKGDQLLDGLRQGLGSEVVPASALRVEWIGPKAGAQLRDDAIMSIVITFFFVMVYIAFRFDVRFAPGVVVGAIHDVTIALGAAVVTQRDISLPTVAALLTIVGYSVNDTVVIFDRIRENLGKYRGLTLSQHINVAVSETLSRTILTTTTTILGLMSFLVFGTGTLKDFAFVMLVGMVSGVYSTIYIASPVTEWVDRRFFGAKGAVAKKIRRTRVQKRAETVV